jgi:uncharacterized membrane protein YhaH (DUF805 family)
MEHFIDGIRYNYVNFDGRARRQEFWMFRLFHFIFLFVAIFIDGFMAREAEIFGVTILYVLATFLPALAVQVRRLHDTNKSGVWLLLYFVPLGGLAILIFNFTDSDYGPNEYGLNPKGLGNQMDDGIEEIGQNLTE